MVRGALPQCQDSPARMLGRLTRMTSWRSRGSTNNSVNVAVSAGAQEARRSMRPAAKSVEPREVSSQHHKSDGSCPVIPALLANSSLTDRSVGPRVAG